MFWKETKIQFSYWTLNLIFLFKSLKMQYLAVCLTRNNKRKMFMLPWALPWKRRFFEREFSSWFSGKFMDDALFALKEICLREFNKKILKTGTQFSYIEKISTHQFSLNRNKFKRSHKSLSLLSVEFLAPVNLFWFEPQDTS